MAPGRLDPARYVKDTDDSIWIKIDELANV